ncbi:hypothetical protein [Myxosarcina sp. GI1(2024)]
MLTHKQIAKSERRRTGDRFLWSGCVDRQPIERAIAEDELREAACCQRVRQLENNLFDEYWEELLAYRKQIGATR